MKHLNVYALANELSLGKPKADVIRIRFGRWDFGDRRLEDGRTVFFVQELTEAGAQKIASRINGSVASGEKGTPVYWGHPDVPELAHKYPDKRAKGWIRRAEVADGELVLSVEWLEENATEGFGWFSPYWGGPARDLGQGRYLKTVDHLISVALVNLPNIQEFRLANELQGGIKNKQTGTEAGEGENGMDRAKLIQALGLPETATDEDIFAAIEKLKSAKADAATKQAAAEGAGRERTRRGQGRPRQRVQGASRPAAGPGDSRGAYQRRRTRRLGRTAEGRFRSRQGRPREREAHQDQERARAGHDGSRSQSQSCRPCERTHEEHPGAELHDGVRAGHQGTP